MHTLWMVEHYRETGSRGHLHCQSAYAPDSSPMEPAPRRTLEYDLSNGRDLKELRQIGTAIRGDATRPHPGDPERWTGGVFAAHQTRPGRIARANERTGFTLALPEPAQRLWRAFRNGDCEDLLDAHRPRLGGGTILAARWRHRSSTDIDLFWPTGLWIPRERHDAIARWAASLTPPPFSVSADTGPVSKIITADGDIDFIESEFADSDITRDRVEGTGLQALDTWEILAGKLYGRGLVPLRDLYDAAVAQLRDPRGLRRAFDRVHAHDWIGATRVKRIPQYCQDVARDGLWSAKREEYILQPTAPDAWERAPDIVADAVSNFIG